MIIIGVVGISLSSIFEGKLSKKAVATIAVTFVGSSLIAYADSVSGESHLYQRQNYASRW